jgi:integrase
MATNIELKNAKPKEKNYTINVDAGLSLLVKTTGGKLWRFRYSFSKNRCMVSLGKYPQTSMSQAKAKQREYMDMLDKGINPSSHKQTQKIKLATEKSFKEVALDWHAKHYKDSRDRFNALILRRLEMYLFPVIGKIPLKDIEAPMLFNLIESIQDLGYLEAGKRVNSCCSMIFRYGVAKGYCSRDITQDYRGMLKNGKTKHMPSLTDEDEISQLLQDMDEYNGTIVVKSALIISAYIFVRPSELANSKWSYIDFEKSEWLIPTELMKMNQEHLIPFPKQVKKLLELLLPITGQSEYIFPSSIHQEKPMSSASVNVALKRMKSGKYHGRMVAHGFRSMASTILNENKFRGEVIEKQLAHQERNKVRGAYNRAEYLEERVELMQWYADYLDKLKAKNI